MEKDSTTRALPYRRRLIKELFNKYVELDRIPMPTTLEGKSRWVVSKVIKRDVKSISSWYFANKDTIYGDKGKRIAIKLLDLYQDANTILNENVNEYSEYFNRLHKIINHEFKD